MAVINPDIVEAELYVLHGKMTAPEVFVDGASQILIGYPLTKILLHTIVNPLESKEIRKVKQILTLSTDSAVELAKLILSAVADNEGYIRNMAEGAKQQADQWIEDAQSITPVELLSEEVQESPSSKLEKKAAKKTK